MIEPDMFQIPVAEFLKNFKPPFDVVVEPARWKDYPDNREPASWRITVTEPASWRITVTDAEGKRSLSKTGFETLDDALTEIRDWKLDGFILWIDGRHYKLGESNAD